MIPLRLAFVNSHPIQYFAPLYASLARDGDLEVTALYCSDISLRGAMDPGFGKPVVWDVDLLEGYRSVFLGKRARRRVPRGFWSLVCPELWSELRRERYDLVVVHGHRFAAYVLAFVLAKLRGVAVAIRCETFSRPGPMRHRLRDAVLSLAYRRVDAFLAIGTANRDYYRALGVPDNRIFFVPYTVDNARFIAEGKEDAEARAGLRVTLGLGREGPVVLFAAKLVRGKHPDDVLRAADLLRREGASLQILIIGSGEMEADLRGLAAQLGLDNVVFGGFVNQARLPSIYAACDIFVMPSEAETWGLTVNEAMCAGLPVVVGDTVGCARDLVKDGVNGRLVRAGDAASLAGALRDLIRDPEARRRMGRASREIISSWSYLQCLEGVRAAAAALRCRHKVPS
jgi:glycosyltransferase involved in cell wall biosynthesis